MASSSAVHWRAPAAVHVAAAAVWVEAFAKQAPRRLMLQASVTDLACRSAQLLAHVSVAGAAAGGAFVDGTLAIGAFVVGAFVVRAFVVGALVGCGPLEQ